MDSTRSGGKVVTYRRRTRLGATPYDRPAPAPPNNSKSPNWLNGIVIPATRMIASGAGKILASVFNSDDSSSSSSSLSSSLDGNSASDYDDVGYDAPTDRVQHNENNRISPEPVKCSEKEIQRSVGKSRTKPEIEQLLLQEKFSREERDRLVKIINSRVVEDAETGQRIEAERAILEAKKWLEEKKVGVSSASELLTGTYNMKPVMLQHIAGETGSPVEVAKSYMRVRPPWSSPSEHILRTPSAMRMQLFKEETPDLNDANLSSSAKKQVCLSSGSWNIQEEIRRVRSKATEDLLASSPTLKIDLSLYSREFKSDLKSTEGDKGVASKGDDTKESVHLKESRLGDVSPEMRMEVSTPHMQEGEGQVGVAPLSATLNSLISEQHQDSQALQVMDGNFASQSQFSPGLDLVAKNSDEKVVESGATQNARLESSEIRSAGVDFEQIQENANLGEVADQKSTGSIPVPENHELLREASVEIPVVYEDKVSSGPQNSSSIHQEEVTQIVNRNGKKSSRNNKRGRGRGK